MESLSKPKSGSRRKVLQDETHSRKSNVMHFKPVGQIVAAIIARLGVRRPLPKKEADQDRRQIHAQEPSVRGPA